MLYEKTVTSGTRTQLSLTLSCRSLKASPQDGTLFAGSPDSVAMFKDYLLDWHSQVAPVDKPFVNRIIQLFNK